MGGISTGAKAKTLRSLKETVIVLECHGCQILGEIDRKEIVKRFKASASLLRVRRGLVGVCERMQCDDGDRCSAVVRARS